MKNCFKMKFLQMLTYNHETWLNQLPYGVCNIAEYWLDFIKTTNYYP